MVPSLIRERRDKASCEEGQRGARQRKAGSRPADRSFLKRNAPGPSTGGSRAAKSKVRTQAGLPGAKAFAVVPEEDRQHYFSPKRALSRRTVFNEFFTISQSLRRRIVSQRETGDGEA